MSSVAVKNKVLRWSLSRSDLTEEDLQHRFPKIREWLDGTSLPTFRQVQSLSIVTRTPLGFLFLDDPPVESLSIPFFRTVDEDRSVQPSPDLLESIQMMLQRQAWMSEYQSEIGLDPLPFVNSATIKMPPIEVAVNMRTVLGLREGWAARNSTWEDALTTLRTAMEDAGILAVVNGVVGNNNHRKLDPDEFRGFVLVDEYAPLVFINNADYKTAQMFTLAHELAHVFYGSSAAFDLRRMQPADDQMEKACDLTAAEFLVPEVEMRETWSSVQEYVEPYQVLARQFKVSTLVVARRALDLKLTSKEEFFNFYSEYLVDERRNVERRPPGGNFYSNQNFRVGRRFAATVIRAIKEKKIHFSEAYHLTGLFGKTFHRYADSIEHGGAFK
ncbi:MAG: ImmA/IrrE family metallo-endopeptidase [Chloroflexi bacterium]|nr:ImmA/IrrE family metallo-endopeptidase [Chloroflexota bacterium]